MAKNILFDCERMKYQHTGLYHFCFHLGNALLRNIDAAKEKIGFYMPEKAGRLFGDNSLYIKQSSYHKFRFPDVRSFDIWHCTYQNSHYKPRLKNIKQVFTIHDLNFLYEKKLRKNKLNRIRSLIQHHIDRSDKICTISEYVKNDVQKHFDLDEKKIEIIYNGCNIDIQKELTQPLIVPGKPFLFSIGTITDKKNFHVLPALLQKNDLLLIIAGIVQNESYLQTIINNAKAYGVENRVIFTGAVSENDKQWYFQNCEAFVFTSIAEGFGLPVIEGMAYGKPVFLSRATSLPEIGGDLAYYFNSFEATDMQHVFESGMVHYNTTNAELSIARRAQFFSWEKAAQRYIEVYRSLY